MKKILVTLVLLSAVSWQSKGQISIGDILGLNLPSTKERSPFVYDLDLQYQFDNREFARSGDMILPSVTNHGIAVTPYAGLQFGQGNNVQHRMMAGIEAFHVMGTSTLLKDTEVNLMLYYQAKLRVRKGLFTGTAGIFPSSCRKGEYGEVFFSDAHLFYDRNLEGLQLNWNASRFKAELGLDWMGCKSYEVKERFQIYSSGSWLAASFFKLGWAAYMYHYASSEIAPGVAENILLDPYVKFDLSKQAHMQDLSLKAGALIGYHRDRVTMAEAEYAFGMETVLNARIRNLGLRNTLYLGDNQQPLRLKTDTSGTLYSDMLYFGSAFYTNAYNLAEMYWNPRINKYVSLELLLRFHFYGESFSYAGCQQVFTLKFDLEGLGQEKFKHGNARKKSKVKLKEDNIFAL